MQRGGHFQSTKIIVATGCAFKFDFFHPASKQAKTSSDQAAQSNPATSRNSVVQRGQKNYTKENERPRTKQLLANESDTEGS